MGTAITKKKKKKRSRENVIQHLIPQQLKCQRCIFTFDSSDSNAGTIGKDSLNARWDQPPKQTETKY